MRRRLTWVFMLDAFSHECSDQQAPRIPRVQLEMFSPAFCDAKFQRSCHRSKPSESDPTRVLGSAFYGRAVDERIDAYIFPDTADSTCLSVLGRLRPCSPRPVELEICYGISKHAGYDRWWQITPRCAATLPGAPVTLMSLA